MKKVFAPLCALMLALALLAGCGSVPASATPEPASSSQPASQPASAPEGAPATGLTVTDMTGREVTLNDPATTVVALAPGDCEILYAIGAGDTLVARGTYCDWPEEVLALPELGSGPDTNIEQVIALQPDLVVLPKMAQTVEQVDALADAGIAVVVSDAQDIAGIYTAIGLLGTLTGRQAEAGALVAGMMADLDAIGKSVPAGAAGTIYFEASPLEYGLWTTGSGTFMDEIATLLGLENAFADMTGWAEVSQEQVLERDPDIIVSIAMYFGDGPTPDEEIVGRPGWEDMKAVQSGTVFTADNNEISRPGPRLVLAAQQLFGYIYPEAELARAA